jgi:hypothetical protein
MDGFYNEKSAPINFKDNRDKFANMVVIRTKLCELGANGRLVVGLEGSWRSLPLGYYWVWGDTIPVESLAGIIDNGLKNQRIGKVLTHLFGSPWPSLPKPSQSLRLPRPAGSKRKRNYPPSWR